MLFALILASLLPALNKSTVPTQPTSVIKIEPDVTGENIGDLALYKAIVSRMKAGENYYAAVADEHRARGYALKPFVTVRLPTLALILVGLGPTWMFILPLFIVLAALFVWHQKLEQQNTVAWQRLIQIGLLAVGLSPILVSQAIYFHEVWAGALIALSFGMHRPTNWLPSLIVAACALSIRELALPYVLLMTAFALFQRRWFETFAWVAVAVLFFASLFLHFQAVSGVVLPSDPKSPSWLLLGGPTNALNFLWQCLPALNVPLIISFPMIVISLFGWLCWRSEVGMFGLLLLLGYMLAFSLIGRPDNFYWGYLISPLLMIGLVFVGSGLQDLRRAIGRA